MTTQKKTVDPKLSYWKEAVQIAFDEVGVSMDIISDDDWDRVAGSLQISAEQEGMAFGYDCIPNPIEQENKALKQKIDFLKVHDCKWVNHLSSACVATGVTANYYYCVHCGRTKKEIA